MQSSTDDIRYDMHQTRTELDGTIAEVRERVSGTIANARGTVREAFDLAEHTRQHPWLAMGAAMAVGALIGATGAAGKAAHAVGDAGEAVADRASDAKDALVDRVRGDGWTPTPGAGGVRGRIADQVQALFTEGLDDLFRGLGRRA